MFTRLRNRVLTVVGPDIPALPSSGGGSSGGTHHGSRDGYDHGGKGNLPEKFRYARPQFLQLLTYDELKASADHNVRPIIVPRDLSLLPWNTGYAECVNSGKSEWNEDQAAFHRQVLSHPSKQYHDLPYTYFGIYDGHAGYGAALAASNQFHHILHEKLVDIIDLLMPRVEGNDSTATGAGVGLNAILPHPILFHKQVSKDELIVGALEAAFADMDAVLAEDRDKYRNAGGCTALVALFILGKLFVANAGDSRGILCKRVSQKKLPNLRPPSIHEDSINGDVNTEEEEDDGYVVYAEPCSFDHTPETERLRLLSVGKLNPNLMGGEYVAMEYAKKPMTKDLGTRILYRQGTMKGWTYKTLTRSDLKMPIVTGEGKRSRLLGTIGVTRGFGDHDLKALGSGLPIKPFLSCHPDVVCIDLSSIETDPEADNCDGDYGVLVMATDGLWDVTYSQKVANTVFTTLKKFPTERHRYTMAAQELVAKSRGRANINGHWRLSDSRAAATVDDISVIVIPVYQYYLEYLEWKSLLQRPKPTAGIVTAAGVRAAATTGEAVASKSDPLEDVNGVLREAEIDDNLFAPASSELLPSEATDVVPSDVSLPVAATD
ncbi:protein phosphatase 1H [Topomyia yanbarensis]|uniref:protein phosphatase 1H n=1 Tax=Topomyia yanbarensis TaxID=2498891 RepID=UPI00273AC169|nr:protein phosphatase 1H [Topomyia yanbarensis]XP_058819485.1 protein phosphatase 1H [Topomyia yanbarensis]